MPSYQTQKPVHSFWSSDSDEDEVTSGEGSAGFDELQSASDVTLPSPGSPLDTQTNPETQIERDLEESCRDAMMNHRNVGGEISQGHGAKLPCAAQAPFVQSVDSATPIYKAAVVANKDGSVSLLEARELQLCCGPDVTYVNERTACPEDSDSVLSAIGGGAAKRETRDAQKRKHKSLALSRATQASYKGDAGELPTNSEFDKSGPRSRSLSRRRLTVKKAFVNDRAMPSEPCSEPCSSKSSRSRSKRRISHRLADRESHYSTYSDDDSSQSSLVALAYASDLLTVDDEVKESANPGRGGSTGEAMWVTGRAASFDFPALTAIS
jgi:hypothetical protein